MTIHWSVNASPLILVFFISLCPPLIVMLWITASSMLWFAASWVSQCSNGNSFVSQQVNPHIYKYIFNLSFLVAMDPCLSVLVCRKLGRPIYWLCGENGTEDSVNLRQLTSKNPTRADSAKSRQNCANPCQKKRKENTDRFQKQDRVAACESSNVQIFIVFFKS